MVRPEAHPADVRLQSAHAEHAEYKPELQRAEAAAQRQLPVLQHMHMNEVCTKICDCC